MKPLTTNNLKKWFKYFDFLTILRKVSNVFLLCYLMFFCAKNVSAQINFGLSTLQNLNIGTPTSLQFGPDGRLYVSNQNGKINIYTIQRNAANDYEVLEQEEINLIYEMPNRNDNGSLNTSLLGRQVTGILVSGTADFPIVYVGSSDPRHGAGTSGTDTGLDTNSGIISRLDWNGTQWTKTDLVRGLPRSEENHSSNGMQLDETNNILYVTQGGHTNMGAISNNFAFHKEYAYSAAILSIDLNMIGNTTYDLPTLDDEDKNNSSSTFGYEDEGDPFGGNNGKNQAMLEENGPVQIFSSGWRNVYDVLITENGRFYTFDNGPNGGWGAAPTSCFYTQEEAGQTYPDNLHLISQNYYGGHPNLTRANRANTFNTTNPQTPIPAGMENPIECQYLIPELEDGAILTIPYSTNGLAEYTASNFGGAMQGDLLAAALNTNGQINRIQLNETGDELLPNGNTILLSGFAGGGFSLDVIAQGDGEPFAGTIWAANIYGGSPITIFEPADYNGGSVGNCTPTIATEDSDSDGFTNQDEADNNTDPCSAASKPSDWDGDFISDLNDNDDDNDGILDINDFFALDSLNGTASFMPRDYAWDNGVEAAGGLLNLGFTGFMNNGTDDYLNLFDTENMTAGGAAGVFTIDEVPAGTAFLNDNSQAYGFQFGVNVTNETNVFFAHTSILAPFAGFIPQNNQSIGIFAGDGSQSNYAKIACVANNGAGGIEFLIEQNDAVVFQQTYDIPILTANLVELFLIFNPNENSLQAAYALDNGQRVDIGTAQTISANLFHILAVGLIATSESALPFAATWADIAVKLDALSVTGTWEEMPCNAFPTCSSEPTHRHENAYVQAGDKFYLLGGRGLKNVQIYNPQDNTWTNGTTPPLELHHFQAVEWNGLIYVIGAFTGDFPNETPVTNVYIYDTVADEWIEGAEIPTTRRRGSAGAVVHNDKIYVVNGIIDGHTSQWVNWLDEYDLLTNTWTTLPDSPQARDHFQAALHDGKIYVAAGRRSGQNTTFSPTIAEIEMYDISTQTWTTFSNDIPTQRASASVAVLGDEILVMGGESEAQQLAHNETEAFNTLTQTWRTLNTLQVGRHGTQAIVNNNNIYITAGAGNRGGGPQLNTQEVFYLYEKTTPILNAIEKGEVETLSTSINFSSVGVGYSQNQMLELKNANGNQCLIIEEMRLTGSNEFSINSNFALPLAIKPQENLEVEVVFSPVSEDLQNANLMIKHSGSNDTINIEMYGSSAANEIRINCGGENYTDALGNVFLADTFFNESLTTYTFLQENFINNTTENPLYQTERNAYLNDLQYDIPVNANANYRVRLHFAELYWASANSRVFDIKIEDETVLNDFDIFAEAGQNTAIVKEFVVSVADTSLHIELMAQSNAAKISAIEIIRDDAAVPNAAPSFSISQNEILLEQDFAHTETIMVTPDEVPFDEQYQIVSYSLSPASVDFANVSIDENNGNITISAVPDAYGSQTFTITANDGQSNNNIFTQQFSLNVNLSAENFEGININCAGNTYINSNGKEFIADQYFLAQYTTFADNTTQNIANTNDETLYQSYRKAYINELQYAIPVPNTAYNIRLHFSENAVNEAGSRVFDINIENNLALNGLDIFAEVGKHTALIKEFNNIQINDGFINMEFVATAGLSVISAIEIEKINTNNTNTPPAFTLSGDVAVEQNFGTTEIVTVTPEAVPANEQNQTVTYSISPVFCLFANLLFDANTGTATITSIPNMIGTQTFTITANDGQAENNTFSQTFTLTVALTNMPPSFTINSNEINVSENFGTTETILVTPNPVLPQEADQTVTYTLSPETVDFANISINSLSGTVTVSAVPNAYGMQVFTIAANDHQAINNIATQSFTLTVNPLNPLNTAPAFTLSGNVEVEQDFATTEYVTVVPASVPPSEMGQVVTYTLTPENVGFANISIDSFSGNVAISAVPNAFGTQVFTITADDGQAENNIYTQDFTLTVNELITIFPLLQINCGGNDYTTNEGAFFEADNYFSTQHTTFAGGSGSFIADTEDDFLYRSNRRGYINDMKYELPVPNNGTYLVRLHFAELTKNAVGERVFDVFIENSLVLNDFDIFAEVGKNVALIREFGNIMVDDGFLNLDFLANSGQLSSISAIEIWQGTSTPNTPPTFSISQNEMTLQQDFATIENIVVMPDMVPTNEQNQIVTYSISPESALFANVNIDENTGNISISAISSAYGSQVFTITANDGQPYNNLATQTFLLEIIPLNTPPSFTTSGNVTVFANFATTENVVITPDAVPTNEQNQTVTYSISPATIDFANISMDENTGNISISAITNAIGTQEFTITADDGQTTNNLATQTFTLTVNPLGVDYVRINCGGGQHNTTTGNIFITDDYYETTTTTYAYTKLNNIANTAEDAIYQSERKAYINELQYSIAVLPFHEYLVRLHFAELYVGVANGRVFDVFVEDSLVLNDYDIFADVGKNVATHKEFIITSQDDMLNINFWAENGAAKISAIEVISNEPTIITTTTAVCDTPTGLYEAQILPNSVTLSWNPVTDASGYIMRGRKEQNNNVYVSDILLTNTVTYNVLPNTTYHWTVSALCPDGESEHGEIRTFATPTGKALENQLVVFGENNPQENNLNVYPNPSSEYIVVSFFNTTEHSINLKISNVLGKTIRYQQYDAILGEQKIELSINELPDGHYFVIIDNGTYVKTKKIYIKK